MVARWHRRSNKSTARKKRHKKYISLDMHGRREGRGGEERRRGGEGRRGGGRGMVLI
jgi:hypothetical protein